MKEKLESSSSNKKKEENTKVASPLLKKFSANKHAGKLKHLFGNALDYQKKCRNEWK